MSRECGCRCWALRCGANAARVSEVAEAPTTDPDRRRSGWLEYGVGASRGSLARAAALANGKPAPEPNLGIW